jgi:hypothetical protein
MRHGLVDQEERKTVAHDACAKAIEKSSDGENVIRKQQDALKKALEPFDAANLLRDWLYTPLVVER